MNKKIIFLIIVIIVIAVGLYYITDFYHADETAKSYLNGTNNISVVKTSNGILLNSSGNQKALIFYPGAKIEYTSYLPLLIQIANNNIDCFLIEMPLNLAFLGENSADEIIDNYNYSNYYIAGHSLGGAMASKYVHNTNKTDALILLESYPTDEINKPVLSIIGSEDKILNMEKYTQSKQFMKNLTEIVIQGGNHGQVGNYNNQSGDGIAKISRNQQQKIIVSEIMNFINKNNDLYEN